MNKESKLDDMKGKSLSPVRSINAVSQESVRAYGETKNIIKVESMQQLERLNQTSFIMNHESKFQNELDFNW